ncbi:MAG: hypothetical protein WC475_05120 [Candidatus Paceibacterota bacterium]
MNIFRKRRSASGEKVWGWNEPIEREIAPKETALGPAASEPSSSQPSMVQDDFLGALAAAAVAEPESQNAGIPMQSVSSSSPISSAEEYNAADRLERISRRLDKLFERIDLVEHKVRRIEGKGPEY